MNKSIGELGRATEKGFGDVKREIADMNTKIERNHWELKAEIKSIVWQVRILLGGVGIVRPIYHSTHE